MSLEAFIAGAEIGINAIHWLVLGILLGIVVGMIPGIGPSLGMAVALPLTFVMEPVNAIILFVGIYNGGAYGGSIAAILINTPGTAAAAATTLDGYPLSRQGQAVKALVISALSSVWGGALATLILITMVPLIISFVLLFQSQHYFLVGLLGIVMIAVIAEGAILKGIVAGGFGIFLATIGISPVGIEQRYTFGSVYLFDGLSFIAVLIGLFAISEMIKLAGEKGSISKEGEIDVSGSIWPGFKSIASHPKLLTKSGIIGLLVGAVPGAGSSVSTFVSYGEAKRSSKNSSTFGEGDERGVMAAEAANNATVTGSLIPTFSFGIPGSGGAAVLLGALIFHGLQPGPSLFSSDLNITYAVFLSLFFGNIVIFTVGVFLVQRLGVITKMGVEYIIPVVIILSVTGGYMLNIRWVDVITVLALGVLGFYMKENDYSIIALVLGMVLGDIIEVNFNRAIDIGGYMNFANDPLSILLLLLIVLLLLSSIRRSPNDLL